MFAFLKFAGRLSGLARPVLLVLLLLFLHLALLEGPLSLAGKALLLVHFGAVLLWQPLVSGTRAFSLVGSLLLALVLATLGVFLSWGLLLLWGLVLVGIFGGKVFHHPALLVRMGYWLALIDVVVVLVGRVLPQILLGVADVPVALENFASWFALPVLVAIAVLGMLQPAEQDEAEVDVVGAVVLVLVVTGVLLGALAFMFVAASDYLEALLQSLGAMVLALLLLTLVWGPRRGFAGLGLELSRRVLGGGQSFELWLREVADQALRNDSPEALVAAALTHLANWRGVCGVRWEVAGDDPAMPPATQVVGQVMGDCTRLQHGALEVEIFTDTPLAPTAAWQFDLMLRILAEFHAARRQTQRLQALSFLRAVHETGARTTHEIKNLLQSLDMLCHAVLSDSGHDPAAVQSLLGQQLPAIRERLHEAMLRMRQPQADDLRPQAVLGWWAGLQARYADARIHYVLSGEPAGVSVPSALFDCVADNLLRNALDKQAREIQVSLAIANAVCSLSVSNDGQIIDAARATHLFLQPLASDSGLGIGLYQGSRLAESAGYRLTLDENREGCVSFGLRPKS